MLLKANQNVIWKYMLGQNRSKQLLKFIFPLHPMRLRPKAMLLMDMKVRYFMNIGYQKFKGMQILINCDSWRVPMFAGKVS